MHRSRSILAVAVATAVALCLAVHARAAYVFEYLAPAPYTSSQDSPFNVKDFGYCLEDFEDGSFDVPGAAGNGSALGPGWLIDSVDADDGTLDGNGNGGHSYYAGDGAGGIVITFDPQRTNGLPWHVGIVWTDGGLGAPVTFEAFDADGNSLGESGPFQHADSSNNGETAEDRFYGIVDLLGISKIRISNPGGGIEVDHLQLDRCVACGDANSDLHITASDALSALRTAVQLQACQLCVCDVNGNGSVAAGDALSILKKSVGQNVAMACPGCVFAD